MQHVHRHSLEVEGKFFHLAGERVFLRVVTYGPYGPEASQSFLGQEPREAFLEWDHARELARIRAAGFHAIRIYTAPASDLLDAALAAGVVLMVGIPWRWMQVFRGGKQESLFTQARLEFLKQLSDWGNHPAVVAVYVANEIPVDIVRWMGAHVVRQSLETLIEDCRGSHPHLLYAYASFPSTEYLEPANADFTAMNVYLENRDRYWAYLARLHNVAGDRPVMISEFGVDSQSLGEGMQAEMLLWAHEQSYGAGCAGLSVYAWSDIWWNHGGWVEDWSFGLTRRDGSAKCALESLAASFLMVGRDRQQLQRSLQKRPQFSVIICTYNGARRIESCLTSLMDLEYSDYEVIVVDDGSQDQTREIVQRFSGVRFISQPSNKGLSAARNLGAKHAKGEVFVYTDDDCQVDREWLFWLARGLSELDCDACGGPNLPPTPIDGDEAIVSAAPGAPSHVLIADREAEHLPGCHIAVRREAFEAIGGFNTDYWIAGDDVDFCWRLEQAGFQMGFQAASFVWHRRRTTLWNYARQQWNYGKAEARLMRDHPERFHRGQGARWKGVVYQGAAIKAQNHSVIYQGKMGAAPYAQICTEIQPRRPLHRDFSSLKHRLMLALCELVQPHLRHWARSLYSLPWRWKVPVHQVLKEEKNRVNPGGVIYEICLAESQRNLRAQGLEALIQLGFQPCSSTDKWDVQKEGQKALVTCEELGDQSWQLRIRYCGLPSEWAKIKKALNEHHEI